MLQDTQAQDNLADRWHRLGLAQQKLVKWTGVACALAYIAVIAVIFGHCTPVRKNWQVVPYPGGECPRVQIDGGWN